MLQQDAERAQLPTVNRVPDGIEFVEYLVGSIGMAGKCLACATLVATGDVTTQMCIRPVVDQILDQFVTALLRSAVKCGDPDSIALIDIGSALDQQLDRLKTVVARGKEQSRFSVVIRAVDWCGVLIEQGEDQVGPPDRRGRKQVDPRVAAEE